MSRSITFRSITVVAMVIALGILLPSAMPAPLAAQEMTTSSTTVHHYADASEVEGAWSTLTRYENGVATSLHTSDLEPGHVYTLWWIIFNEPANCGGGMCTEDDILVFDEAGELVIEENNFVLNIEQVEAAQISVLGATGTVADANGEAHFSAWLGMGDLPGIMFGPGLVIPENAEIHLVVRGHGPLVPDLLHEQLLYFNGGCDDEWPNEPCVDAQFAVHLPPM